MSEMIERVARAMATVELQPGPRWPQIARAAIAAMREPTEAMLGAGDSMMPQIARGEDITTGRDALAEAWPAMIDEALK